MMQVAGLENPMPRPSFLGACQSHECQQVINKAAGLEMLQRSERLIVGAEVRGCLGRESFIQGSVENVAFYLDIKAFPG